MRFFWKMPESKLEMRFFQTGNDRETAILCILIPYFEILSPNRHVKWWFWYFDFDF